MPYLADLRQLWPRRDVNPSVAEASRHSAEIRQCLVSTGSMIQHVNCLYRRTFLYALIFKRIDALLLLLARSRRGIRVAERVRRGNIEQAIRAAHWVRHGESVPAHAAYSCLDRYLVFSEGHVLVRQQRALKWRDMLENCCRCAISTWRRRLTAGGYYARQQGAPHHKPGDEQF